MLIKYLSLLLVMFCSSYALSLDFADVTDISKTEGTGVGNGLAFADYDNDGDLDIYASSDPHDILYRNNGDGTFDDVTAEAGISVDGDGVAVAFGDYDNDGDLDLYVAVNDGSDVFFQNEGGKIFRDITRDVRIDNPGRARSASFADFDNDGFLDIFVVNENSASILYRNRNGKNFEDVSQIMNIIQQGPGRCHAWGDYDNDGDLDLYITNKGAMNVLYRNDGKGFKDVTGQAGVEGMGDSTGTAFADYDNDGNLDICVGDVSQVFLYHNNGNGTFINVANKAGLAHSGRGCTPAFGDYDNDGYLDLYLAVWEGRAVMYHNNGDGTFTDVTAEWGFGALGNGWSAVSGDYNGDGMLDIYTSYTTRFNILYHNNGNDNNWLHIKTIGSLSNRDGIGAKIMLQAGELVQIREISPITGYGSQDSFIAEFGLGKETVAEAIDVRWPSGIITRLVNVKANQILVIAESFSAVEEPNSIPSIINTVNRLEKALLQNYPNPFNPETWIPYKLSEQSFVEIDIYDSKGLLVRKLKPGNRMAGSYISRSRAAYWDGKNDQGQPVSAGIYFYHLKSRDYQQVMKMILIE